MAEHEHAHEGDRWNPLSSIFHVGGEAAHSAHGLLHHSKAGRAVSGSVQDLAGFVEIAHAIDECADGEGEACAHGLASGIKDIVQGSTGMYDPHHHPGAAGLGKVANWFSAGLDAFDAARAFAHGDVEEGVENAGSSLIQLLPIPGAAAAAPVWRAAYGVAGPYVHNFAEASSKDAGLGDSYSDWVAELVYQDTKWAYDLFPDVVADIIGAPEALILGAGAGVYSAGHGVYSAAKRGVTSAVNETARGVSTYADALLAANHTEAAHARTGHDWKLGNPLAPMRAQACYEANDPRAVMQAFGHYVD